MRKRKRIFITRLTSEFIFGKYKGLSTQEVLDKDPGYIVWLHSVDNNSPFKLNNTIYKLALEKLKEKAL